MKDSDKGRASRRKWREREWSRDGSEKYRLRKDANYAIEIANRERE